MFALQSTGGYRLLEMTALTGEFPASSLGRLVGESRYKEKIITQLKTQKLLKTYYRDGLRSYRLTIGGRDLLLKEASARFGPLLEGPNQTRSDLPHRLRLLQMGEVCLAMKLAEVLLLLILFAFIMKLGFAEGGEYDRERKLMISGKGTYGTAGFMSCGRPNHFWKSETSVTARGLFLANLMGKSSRCPTTPISIKIWPYTARPAA